MSKDFTLPWPFQPRPGFSLQLVGGVQGWSVEDLGPLGPGLPSADALGHSGGIGGLHDMPHRHTVSMSDRDWVLAAQATI